MPPVPSGIGKHLGEDKPWSTSRPVVPVSVGSSLSVACSFPLESSILWPLRSPDAARAAGVGLIPRATPPGFVPLSAPSDGDGPRQDPGAVAVFVSAPPSKITETKLRRQVTRRRRCLFSFPRPLHYGSFHLSAKRSARPSSSTDPFLVLG